VNFVTALHRLARSPGQDAIAGSRTLSLMVERLQARTTELRVQQLANTAWSCAKLQVRHAPLRDAIAASSLPSLTQFAAQECSNIAWSFAKCNLLTVPLMHALGTECAKIIGDFIPQHLGNTA